MATSVITLKVSEEVTTMTDVADTYTPANGASVYLNEFFGDSAYTQNSAVVIVWDYGGTEQYIWSTKGTSRDKGLKEFVGTGDGVKKVALVCKNGEGGNLIMFGKAIITVDT